MVSAVRWDTIGAAIATKLAAVSGIDNASSTDLSNVVLTPSVKVLLPQRIDIGQQTGGHEELRGDFTCDLLVAKTADVGTAFATVYTLIEAIRVAWWTNETLGLTEVASSSTVSYELLSLTYGGIEYPGCRIMVAVVCRSTGNRTA